VVSEPAERISISTEHTFPQDVDSMADLVASVTQMAGRLSESLLRSDRAARTIGIKLRYPDFTTITRDHSLGGATSDAGEIAAVAEALLAQALEDRSGPIRLLGVRASGLTGYAQLTLFQTDAAPDSPEA
jgi:DNA polymerase-4